ncbi:hypothetical protein E3E31_00005 [Thermococcus sp. M39]|nr:hypothetical protein [Thermococcus sp. M39]
MGNLILLFTRKYYQFFTFHIIAEFLNPQNLDRWVVDYSLAVPILVPVVIGSWFGAKTAVKIGSQKLKIVFQIISALTILKLLSGVL